MFKYLMSKITHISRKKEDKSSKFSKFFREESSRGKKKVFLDVARKASGEQLEVIKSAELVR